MADKFDIEAKLLVTGVEVKGNLDLGTLKFKVDTSALRKLVSDAGKTAKQVKAKFDNIKLKKLKLEVNQNSLRSVEAQIRRAVENAVKKTKLDIQTSVAGGTKTDPFKAQRQAASKSAQSLAKMHELTRQVNSGLRSMIKTLGSVGGGSSGASAPKGNLPFPAGTRTVSVSDLGGGGGRPPRPPGPGASPGGEGRGSGGIRDLANATQQLTDNTKGAVAAQKDLEELTFEVGKKAAAFRGVAIAINTVVTASQEAVKFVIEFNDSLIEVNKILQLTDATLQKLGDDLFRLSAETGIAVDQTIAISETFARAGLAGRGYGTIVELTDRALTGLQGTTLDAAQSSELFIQIIQQVEGGVRGLSKELITTTKLFDVLGKAEDITASKATDVQQAFKRSAASIFATGTTIEEATAVISVLQERTQRGGDVIGTALKTLASRISSSSSDATKALNAIGVETIDAQGNLRNLFDVLQDTAVAFQSLTESERADVAVKAAGIRQVEVFRAALLDFGRTQDVTNQLVEASGDAARKQAAEQSKLSNVISRLQIAFQQLVRTASEGVIGEAFVFALTSVEKLFTGVAKLDKILGGAASTFAGLVAIGLGMKVLIPMLAGIGKAIGFFIGLQKESAAAMVGIERGGMKVANTVSGKMNSAIVKTAATTKEAGAAMNSLGAATLFAASQAERLAKARAAAQLASPAGQASVANRNRGNISGAGFDITGSGGSGGRAFLDSQRRNMGFFGKAIGGVTRGLDFMGKNVLAFSAIASIAGGSLQSFANDLKGNGNDVAGTALDIGGGILSGAGLGATIGSFVPVIGTAVGAAVGGVLGAIEPLNSVFNSAGNEIEDLRKKYLELNIIQKENGEITSAVSEKLDRALRNLTAFQNFESGLKAAQEERFTDPESSDRRRAEIESTRIAAQKSLEASFDKNASIQEKNARIAQALTKVLQARTGQQDLNLGAAELRNPNAPVLGSINENVLNEIRDEAIRFAESFGSSGDEISRIFEEEVKRAGGRTGKALPNILNRALAQLGNSITSTQLDKRNTRASQARQEVTSAFGGLRTEFAFRDVGDFLESPVNRLEVQLRDFISDFGREIQKLSDVQTSAITPQNELAAALAKNAAVAADAARRRARLETADAAQRARLQIQQIPGQGEIVGGEGSTRTAGNAIQELFQAMLDASRQISRDGVVDPDEQRRILANTRGDVNIEGLNEDQIKAVTDNVLKLTKTMVKLDTEAFQAVIKSNAAAVNELKKRISEEERVLGVDRRRREAAALNARAVAEELTGVRRLVAEREIESQLLDASISAQQNRLSSIDSELEALRATEQTETNRVAVLEKIRILEEKRTTDSIALEEMLAKRRIEAIRDSLQVANLAVQESKRVGGQERKRIGLLSDISSLLSVDTSQMVQFNAQLENLGAQFRTSQAELAAEAAKVNATVTDQAERETQLADIKQRGAALALEQAKAEAEVIARRKDAIKQTAQELVGNAEEQVQAQKEIIDATKNLSNVYESYLQAVDGAILATTRYNLGLELASVAATKVTGGFTGLTEEVGVVQEAFRDAENLARQLGASEKTLVQIRRESINQQLALFNQLLADQTQAARSFFTSSAQDQADLFLGVQEAQGLAGLLGGSFDEFKKKGDAAINDLGAQILSLPQESRQRIQEAIGLLQTTGGTVGGFTADQLQTALDEAVFGRPTDGGGLTVDPIIAVQEKIAALTEEQAQLATEELISSQEQVNNAKEQLEVAQAAKDLAEIQLERIKEDGAQLRGKLSELRGQLNTTLLQQDQTARTGFNAVTNAVSRAANDVVTKLPDAFSVKVAEAFREIMSQGGLPVSTAVTAGLDQASSSRATPQTRGRMLADSRRAQGRNLAEQQQIASQGGNGTIIPAIAAGAAPTSAGSNNPNDPSSEQTNRSLSDILGELQNLNSSSDDTLTAIQEIRDSGGNTLGTANATVGSGSATEITVNVNGEQRVTVTGFEAGVVRVAQALSETFGGFATETEARAIANEILENIRTELLRRGILTPNSL